jgi:hypothetical protein
MAVETAQVVAEAGPVAGADERGQRPAEQRPRVGAEQAGCAPVDVGDDPGAVGDQVGDRRLLEQRAVPVEAAPELPVAPGQLPVLGAGAHALEVPTTPRAQSGGGKPGYSP